MPAHAYSLGWVSRFLVALALAQVTVAADPQAALRGAPLEDASASPQPAAWDPSPAAEVPAPAGSTPEAIKADQVTAAKNDAQKADLANTMGWLWEPVPADEGVKASESKSVEEVVELPAVDETVQMNEKQEALAQDATPAAKAPVVKAATVCPTAISWIVAQSETSEDEVDEVECADMGTCNKETKQCECFEHYSGDACERSSLPPADGTEIIDTTESSEKALKADEPVAVKTEAAETPATEAGASGGEAAAEEVVMAPSPAPTTTSICPKAAAVVTLGDAEEGASPLAECSNKGICNAETAKCECFENYDGDACERLNLGEIPDDLTDEELEQRVIAADEAAEEEAARTSARRK